MKRLFAYILVGVICISAGLALYSISTNYETLFFLGGGGQTFAGTEILNQIAIGQILTGKGVSSEYALRYGIFYTFDDEGILSGSLGDVLRLFLNGAEETRKYEYGTTVNLSGTLDGNQICFDILDESGRFLNYSCGQNTSYQINHTIIIKFNDSTTTSNFTASAASKNISIDNRTDLREFLINITGDVKLSDSTTELTTLSDDFDNTNPDNWQVFNGSFGSAIDRTTNQWVITGDTNTNNSHVFFNITKNISTINSFEVNFTFRVNGTGQVDDALLIYGHFAQRPSWTNLNNPATTGIWIAMDTNNIYSIIRNSTSALDFRQMQGGATLTDDVWYYGRITANSTHVRFLIDDVYNFATPLADNITRVDNLSLSNTGYAILTGQGLDAGSGGDSFVMGDNWTAIFNGSTTPQEDYPSDISIDLGDNGRDVHIPGRIVKNTYQINKFRYLGTNYTTLNLSFTEAGEKIIEFNVTNSGNRSRPGRLNFTITSFDIDSGNSLFYHQNFSNVLGGAYTGNLSINSPGIYDSLTTNATFHRFNWSNLNIVTSTYCPTKGTGGIGINKSTPATDFNGYAENYQMIYNVVEASSTSCTSANTYYSSDVSPDIDMAFINQLDVNLYFRTNVDPSGANGYTHFKAGFYGEGNQQNVLIEEFEFIRGGPSPQSYQQGINMTITRVGDNSYQVIKRYALGSISNNTYSTTSLNGSIKLFFHNDARRDSSTGTASSVVEIREMNVSSLMLNKTNTTYSPLSVNYTREVFDAPNNILRAKVAYNHIIPTHLGAITNNTFYLSNDNGTTYETVFNDTYHTFQSTGSVLRLRINMNSTNNLVSPMVTDIKVYITPTSGSDLAIDVGNDGIIESNFTFGLNSTNTPLNYTGNDTYILNVNCGSNLTCNIPVRFIANQSGQVQISNFNYTKNPNPINITVFGSEETMNLMPINFSINHGLVNITGFSLEFFGSKTIPVIAYPLSDPTNRVNFSILVRYSEFNLTFPSGQPYWQIFPSKRNQSDIQPFGQNSTNGIWLVTSEAYEDNFSIHAKYNESVMDCVQNMTFSGMNFSKSLTANKTLNATLTTSFKEVMSNVNLSNSGDIFTYTDIACGNTTTLLEIPYFCFRSICTDCVRTYDWNATCNWIG